MEGEVIAFLNNSISSGTLIALLIVCGSIVVAVLGFINKLMDRHDKKLKKRVLDDIEDENLMITVKKLSQTVETLTNQVSTLNENLGKYRGKTDRCIQNLSEKVDSMNEKLEQEIIPKINEMDKTVCQVTESDQSAIKSFIIQQYHQWMEKKYIDIYSLSIIEDRYKTYDARNGNTFVLDLMQQLRELPSRPMIVDVNGNDPVKYFQNHPDHHPKYKNPLLSYNDNIVTMIEE